MNCSNSKVLNRRTLLIAAAGAAPLLALGAGRASAAGLPQSAVAYQTSPREDKQCGGCNLFVAPSSCKSVSGAVTPNGWCKLWVKKA
ncbi:MAG: high potential iron sulfur protein [Roseiarcus sp.]